MRQDALHAQGLRVANQVPQDPVTAGESGLRQISAFLLGQTGRDEPLQMVSGLVEHTHRPVAGTDQLHGSGHDAVQHRGQLDLPADGHHRVQQTLQPVHGVQQRPQLLVDPAQLGTQTFVQVGYVRLPRMDALLDSRHHERPGTTWPISVAVGLQQSLRVGAGPAHTIAECISASRQDPR